MEHQTLAQTDLAALNDKFPEPSQSKLKSPALLPLMDQFRVLQEMKIFPRQH
jgi:hypothetical protein